MSDVIAQPAARPAWFGYFIVCSAVIIVLLVGYIAHAYRQAHAGSTTQATLCAKFNAVDRAVTGSDDNAAFGALGKLGDAATRYDDPDVKQEASGLHQLAHAKSASGNQIMASTSAIANVCGHPIGLGGLFG